MSGLRILYLLMGVQGLSLLGTRMTSMSIGIWLYHSTHQTTPILWISLFNELPAMLAGSLAGIWVDRLPKRVVLLLSDAGQAVGSLLLMCSFWIGFFSLPLLYVVVFSQGICAMFQAPASQTVTAMLASEEKRDRVNGIKEMVFPLAGIIAPACVSLLYHPLGITGIALVDACTFVASAVFLLSVRLPDESRKELNEVQAAGGLRDVFEGIVFLFRHRLIGLAVYIGVITFLLNGTLDMVVPYVSGSSGNIGWGVSFVLTCMNAGAFAGALIVALISGFRNRITTLMTGYLLTGLMFIAFGWATGPIWRGVTLFVLMIPLPATNALLNSHFQSIVPPALQGRVFAFLYQINLASAVVSFAVMGPLVDRILQPAAEEGAHSWLFRYFSDQRVAGIAVLLIATGIVIIAVTITAMLLRRRMKS
ncbi:MFS transporter [Paenibacillus sp. BC26]|uniref:MFS transporter n=1 Tax=Paenibacillus sp. BC26 TaxID=1881032 RepID=UPI0008E0669F|nr:MFS transporter [Paenibacillus sp. BC26]SFT29192.1 Major Facilitator Superfamily protein [Paenibacillus sp. BC26]